MRLIDADELLKKATKDGAYDYVSAKEIADQPTAYDVEAVVRELEEAKFVCYMEDDKEASGYNDGLNEAIKIVKRGGRDEV